MTNGFPNINGNGVLLTCDLVRGQIQENDFLIIDNITKIQIREVEEIISLSNIKKYSFVILREYENIVKWSELFGSELKVENENY